MSKYIYWIALLTAFLALPEAIHTSSFSSSSDEATPSSPPQDPCAKYPVCQYNAGGSCGAGELSYVSCSYNMSCFRGRCTTGYASGAACTYDQDCQAGLQCMRNAANNKVCSPQYLLPGQNCVRDADCIFYSDIASPSTSTCVSGKCAGLGLGASCSFGGQQCNTPLFCQFDTSTCQYPIPAGQPCREYYDSCAGVMSNCYSTDGYRQTSFCREDLTKSAGEYCYRHVECGDGLYCDSPSSTCKVADIATLNSCPTSNMNPKGFHDAVYHFTACKQANPACNFQECDACLSQHCEVIQARRGIILMGEICSATPYQRAYLLSCSHEAKYHSYPAQPSSPQAPSYPASPASNYSQAYNYSGSTAFDNCTQWSNSSMPNNGMSTSNSMPNNSNSNSMSNNSTSYICMNSSGTYNCTFYTNHTQANCTNITQPSPSPSPSSPR